MIWLSAAYFFILLRLEWSAEGVKIRDTPIMKVTSLLKDLSAKLAAEGKAETTQFEKFNDFCRTQADEKQHSMENSEALIDGLKSDVEALETVRQSLASAMMKLNLKISDLEDDITRNTKEQADRHKKYLEIAHDVSDAIGACGDAISTFKRSKGQMLNAKLDLFQVTSGLVTIVERQPLLSVAPGALALISRLKQKGTPQYTYQSNDIIGALSDLQVSFMSMKKNMDLDEMKANAILESKTLGLVTEKKFAEKEKAGTEALVSAKTEKLQSAKVHMTDEDEDYWADSDFLSQLKNECSDKATLFEERSRARAAELRALATAATTLEQGAAPNYKGNKALVGLQVAAAPVTLVQVGSARNQRARDETPLDRVQDFLEDAADRLGSRALSNMAWHVRTSRHSRLSALQKGDSRARSEFLQNTDNFDKVRGLIRDLLKKLQDDAEDESDQKAKCDHIFKQRTADRDATNDHIEVASGDLAQLRADRKVLQDDTEVLGSQTLELKKGVLEFNKIYDDDMAVKDDAVDMLEKGIEAVDFALTTLQNFYGASLAQMSSSAALADADYEQPHLQPTVFIDAYHGARAESNGIIGILEVILADFQRSEHNAKQDIIDAQKERDEFEGASAADMKKKTDKKASNAAAIAKLTSSILDSENYLAEQKKALSSTLDVMDAWSSECAEGEGWEERNKAREKEIEALRQSMTMLGDSRFET